jgi:hypothetical protein
MDLVAPPQRGERERAAAQLAAAERELREAQVALSCDGSEAARTRYARAVAQEKAAHQEACCLLAREGSA